ncbi:MAG: tyrosine-type recombinase/integrase [Candidatus Muirbacterium halophilum]|nr:tyrosine-type recombinase/integrase [Candidatus Muirbacterium halophilum]
MKDVKASIIARLGRKFWYIRFQVFYENDSEKIQEISSKILKTEKTKKWMELHYLPVWVSRKKEELKIGVMKSQNFGYFCSIFLKNYEVNHDYQNVKYRTDRILRDFSNVSIKKITKLDIKQWLNNLKNSQTGEELTKNSKMKYLRIFHGVFEVAADDEIVRNFTFEIKIDGKKRSLDTIKPFEKHEVIELLEASKDPIYGVLLHNYLGIAFNQGMSPSEILGLQIGDLDLVNRTISIKRNLTKGKIKETKTEFRNRVIPLFDSSFSYFEDLITIAKKKRSIWLFSRENGSNLVDIIDIRGTRSLVKNDRKIKNITKWYKLLTDIDIEFRDLKNCRHTFAVLALESKQFTMQEVANILGHSDLQMLIKHYARYIEKKALRANRKINLFSDTLSDTSKKKDFS